MKEGPMGEEPRGLSVLNLCKDYPAPEKPLHVIRDVSFDLAAGESLVVAGPSGSGKSTLLNILGTLDEPTSGRILLGGIDPRELQPRELAGFRGRRIGFIFQDHHLLPQCTALENVLLAALAVGDSGKDAERRGRDLLDRVGMADRINHLPAELSGGQRQRVAIARALMNSPTLLLADEPSGNLDRHIAAEVGGLLADLVADGEMMLVLATHDRELASRFPRRLRFVDGQLQLAKDLDA